MMGNGVLALAADSVDQSRQPEAGRLGDWFDTATETGLTAAGVALVVVVVLVLADRVLHHYWQGRLVPRFQRHLILLGLTLVGVALVAVALPSPADEQILKLLGILLSAAVAFSSTTLISNAVGGVLLRAHRHYRSGDWLRTDEYFGRVSERGLFFTEIQTELRDLVTLPNAYLVSRPVTVIRSPSTLIHADVSLGYDVSRRKVEGLLLEAAAAAELEEAFVHIRELGDFSVTYRVFGLLDDTRHLLTRHSVLRARVLDALHRGGVEVVSPNFMNQRLLAQDRVFIPPPESAGPEIEPEVAAEAVMFDKAENAASLERLEDLLEGIDERIERLRGELDEKTVEEEQATLEGKLERFQRRRAWLVELVEKRKQELEEGRGKGGATAADDRGADGS